MDEEDDRRTSWPTSGLATGCVACLACLLSFFSPSFRLFFFFFWRFRSPRRRSYKSTRLGWAGLVGLSCSRIQSTGNLLVRRRRPAKSRPPRGENEGKVKVRPEAHHHHPAVRYETRGGPPALFRSLKQKQQQLTWPSCRYA